MKTVKSGLSSRVSFGELDPREKRCPAATSRACQGCNVFKNIGNGTASKSLQRLNILVSVLHMLCLGFTLDELLSCALCCLLRVEFVE